MKKHAWLKFVAIICLAGCASMFNRSHDSGLRLQDVRKVKPGITTKAQIAKIFGKPDEVFLPANFTDQQMKGESWRYRDKGFDRALFYFPKNSKVVNTVTWRVFDGDPEQQLKVALSNFQKARWKVTTTEWINPHAIPAECIFEDKALGFSVAYGKRRKEVRSMWWWDPSRTPATSNKRKGKPPQFCLGGKCEDAIHRNEWLKTTNWPLCEVPK